MNLEMYIIKAFVLNKSLYDKYNTYIDINKIKEVSRETYFLFKTLTEMYSKMEYISLDEYISYFHVSYPDADMNIYNALFEQIKTIEVSAEGAETILNKLSEKYKHLELSELAYKAATGISSVESLHEYIASLNTKVDHQVSLQPTTDDLETLLEGAYAQKGLRWRLDCLNKSLGSLRAGDFGFLFARPETGKTTFLASEISNMLTQTDKHIIWINNEEDGRKVMLRVYQAFFGVRLENIMANPSKYKTLFLEQTGGRLKMFDSATISKRDVEAIVNKYEPILTIYDQLDKIKGFSNDREDLRLGSIYQWARELAKGQHAAIGVSQADGHAEGVRYLTMEHVANAKTAKQAEADFIFGIGKSHDEGTEYIRFLNISKNKLLGDSDSIPDLRHGRFEVLIEADIARYKDLISYG